MYLLFIAKLNDGMAIEELRSYFSEFLRDFSLKRSKSRGKNAIHNGILKVRSKEAYEFLLSRTFRFKGKVLKIKPFVTKT